MPSTRVLLNSKAHQLGWLKTKKLKKIPIGKYELTIPTTKKFSKTFFLYTAYMKITYQIR